MRPHSSQCLKFAPAYRPLYILDSVGKFFEKIIDTRLKLICEEKSLLNPNQYGFRRGRSTIDAISHFMRIAKIGLDTKTMVGILTLDVRNAFNSAPWQMISESLRDKGIPQYLHRILDSYFDKRILTYDDSGENKTRRLTAGVPQGSVLGPTLWNFLYDRLLRLPIPDGVEIVVYADDVAIVARVVKTFNVGELLEDAAEKIADWLEDIGIQFALQKTELLLPTRKKTFNTLEVNIKGHIVKS